MPQNDNEPTIGDVVEQAARIAHEVNRAYCLCIGDKSQVAWDDAPSWQRESAKVGVRLIMSNPATTAKESHASWLRMKVADGWVYGPRKNPETKEHPCMVPYEHLPAEQQAKDHLFGAAVRAALM